MNQSDDSLLCRRALLGGTAVITASLAGCSGDSNNSPRNDSDDSAPESDSSSNSQSSNQSIPDRETPLPEFVTSADPSFRRVEPDWNAGRLTIEFDNSLLNSSEEQEQEQEVSQFVLVSGGTVISQVTGSSGGELPIGLWGANDSLNSTENYNTVNSPSFDDFYGDLSIEARNDAGDVLSRAALEITSEIEITDVAFARNTATKNFGESSGEPTWKLVEVAIELSGPIGYISDIVFEIEGWNMTFNTVDNRDRAGQVRSNKSLAHASSRDPYIAFAQDELVIGNQWAVTGQFEDPGECDSTTGSLAIYTPERKHTLSIDVASGEPMTQLSEYCTESSIEVTESSATEDID